MKCESIGSKMEELQAQEEGSELDVDIAFADGFDEFGENSDDAIQEIIQQNPSFSEGQIRELFEQNNQRLFGKIGEINREVMRLDALAQSSVQSREFQPLQVTADMFSNMREEFGEDFADALARDLSQIPLHQQGGIDQNQIDYIVQQKVSQMENNFEMKMVTREHPDWDAIAQSQDFNGWKNQLPNDVQERLDTSWDSNFISAAISAYKRDKTLHQENQSKKNRRLESAVMPHSTGGFDDNYDDDFEAGFNSD
jgi:hypothetical protein